MATLMGNIIIHWVSGHPFSDKVICLLTKHLFRLDSCITKQLFHFASTILVDWTPRYPFFSHLNHLGASRGLVYFLIFISFFNDSQGLTYWVSNWVISCQNMSYSNWQNDEKPWDPCNCSKLFTIWL